MDTRIVKTWQPCVASWWRDRAAIHPPRQRSCNSLDVMAPNDPGRRLGIHLAAVLGGIGVVGLLVWNVGISEVASHLRQVGWFAPVVLLPYAAVAVCDARGWAYALPPLAQAQQVPLWRLSLFRLAGEAVNNLTPTANIGGEPLKVYLLRTHGLPTDAGLASVVVAKTALTVSQVIFILLGVPFFLYRLGWVRQGWWVLGPLLLLAYSFVLLLIRWQKRGLMTMVVQALQRRLPRWQRLEQWRESAQRIDALVVGQHRDFCAIARLARHTFDLDR